MLRSEEEPEDSATEARQGSERSRAGHEPPPPPSTDPGHMQPLKHGCGQPNDGSIKAPNPFREKKKTHTVKPTKYNP